MAHIGNNNEMTDGQVPRCRLADMTEEVKTHPVQRPHSLVRDKSRCPQIVTMKAYEVYCEVCSPQEALITGDCRGGLSTGELIAFLYAYTFPKSEWRMRVKEAFNGMENL